ncbi:hypothetical protein [Peijinzhouia sedimentorum]
MKLIEVKDKKTKKEFLEFPSRLYQDDPYYIRPLDKDIESVFDKEKNKVARMKSADFIRWILVNDKGETIGKVAAFINPKTKDKNDQPTGGLGFFDCVDDQEAANLLFDACKNWLAERGCEAMDGPINFGERDKWWGLLVDGFTEPNYCMHYNFPYYRQLFENYGFQLFFNQYTYARATKVDQATDKYKDRATKILADPDYEFRYIPMNEMHKAPYYFLEVYNNAWGGHAGVKELSETQALAMFKSMKPVIDPRLIYFGFYKGTPVSFFISLPELNQIFKHLDGQLDWLGKLKFLYYKKFKPSTKMLSLVFGVVPGHQGKGVESAMVRKFQEMIFERGFPYDTTEMNWIGDFNPKMMRVAEQIGGKIYKTHITYRYLFDRGKEFKRYPFIGK